MAQWTDKDVFHLVHYTHNTYYHSIRPGVLNDLRQYSGTGDVLPIRTNGEVITAWWSEEYIKAHPINRTALATLIRQTRPDEGLPVLVVSIPEIEQADVGSVVYCWMHINSAKTMQIYHYNNAAKSNGTFEIPKTDNDPVNGFSSNSPISSIGTPRIYYDWREALAPITNYFKAVIKYCKDTGRERRLAAEAANRALNDRTGTIRTLVSKNDKRFKGIEF